MSVKFQSGESSRIKAGKRSPDDDSIRDDKNDSEYTATTEWRLSRLKEIPLARTEMSVYVRNCQVNSGGGVTPYQGRRGITSFFRSVIERSHCSSGSHSCPIVRRMPKPPTL